MQSFETLNMTRGDKAGQTSSTSPSLSSPSNAASRQKSCNACVRGKRRCDKTAPRCTRCAAKGLECVYQRIPPGSSASAVTLAQSSARLSEAADSGYKPASAELTDDDFEMGGFDASDLASVYGRGHGHDGRHGMAGGNSSTSTSTSPDLVLDPSLDFSIADLLGASSCSSAGTGSGAGTGTMTTPDADSSSSMVGLWNLPGFDEPKADFPTLTQSFSFSESPFLLQPQPQPQLQQQQQQHQPQQQQQQQKQIIRDVTILNNARDTGKCFTLDPLLIHDPRSNVGYMTNHFTTMHCDFVRSRALPFAHPRLYTHNMPKTIMAAYCGAAAYTSRSPATRAWAFRAVQDATAEVHREGASATSPLEKLARCHALFVLESIRIFDGDIALRYASERERPLLKEWTLELLEVVKGFGDSALAKVDMEQSPATWNVSSPSPSPSPSPPLSPFDSG